MTTKAIVIVGGGFAGTTLAQALDGKLPRDRELLADDLHRLREMRERYERRGEHYR